MIKNGVTKYTMMGMNECTIHFSPIKVLSPFSNSNLEKQQDGRRRNEILHICFPFVLTGFQYNIKQVTAYFTSIWSVHSWFQAFAMFCMLYAFFALCALFAIHRSHDHWLSHWCHCSGYSL